MIVKPGNVVEKTGASIVDQEIAWLDRLRAKLEPHVDVAVEMLVQLAKSSSRDSVRAAAASKIVGLYAQCAADSAALKLKDKREPEREDNVRVLIVEKGQLGEASQQLAADYQARRAAIRDAG